MAHSLNAYKAVSSPHVQAFLKFNMSKAQVTLLGKPILVEGPLNTLIERQVPDQINGPVVKYNRVCISGHVFHSEQ